MLAIQLLKRFTVVLTLTCALSHAQLALAAYPEKSLRLIAPLRQVVALIKCPGRWERG